MNDELPREIWAWTATGRNNCGAWHIDNVFPHERQYIRRDLDIEKRRALADALDNFINTDKRDGTLILVLAYLREGLPE
jgi:hypothetical protein